MTSQTSNLGDHSPAVLFRQHHIDNEKIVPSGAGEFQTGFAIFCDLDGKAGFAQPLGQKGRRLFLVFDQKNSHHTDYRTAQPGTPSREIGAMAKAAVKRAPARSQCVPISPSSPTHL